jgi:proprotein convertase subtilisin/kexin type 9
MPAVDYVEEEGFAVGTQSIPEWHLDRLDQIDPMLDNSYWPIGDAQGIDVYVLDTGINYEHEEFEYRAKYAGRDPTDEYNANNFPESNMVRQYGNDCNGHGTHVASLCGGKTYGSAKKVTLYSVRVLGCNNAGPWSGVLDGIDHVVKMVERTNRPSIMSMSFSGSNYQVINDAITSALNSGVMSIVAAGNGREDACSRSPASHRRVITVGGTRQGDGLYLVGSGTNFGRCIDIFAPGERVLAADHTCTNCSKHLSGTSMSTPLVSGLAAIMLGKEPLLSVDQLKEKLISQSLKGAIDYSGMPGSQRAVTPNRLATVMGENNANPRNFHMDRTLMCRVLQNLCKQSQDCTLFLICR